MSTTPESSARDERAPSRSDVDRVVGSFPRPRGTRRLWSAAPGRRHLVAGTWSPAVRSSVSILPNEARRSRSQPGGSTLHVHRDGLIQGETFERGSCRGGNPLRSTTRHLLGGSCTGRVSDALAPLPRSRGNV